MGARSAPPCLLPADWDPAKLFDFPKQVLVGSMGALMCCRFPSVCHTFFSRKLFHQKLPRPGIELETSSFLPFNLANCTNNHSFTWTHCKSVHESPSLKKHKWTPQLLEPTKDKTPLWSDSKSIWMWVDRKSDYETHSTTTSFSISPFFWNPQKTRSRMTGTPWGWGRAARPIPLPLTHLFGTSGALDLIGCRARPSVTLFFQEKHLSQKVSEIAWNRTLDLLLMNRKTYQLN